MLLYSLSISRAGWTGWIFDSGFLGALFFMKCPSFPIYSNRTKPRALHQCFSVPCTLLKQVSDSINEESMGTWAGVLDCSARQLAEDAADLGCLR
ncbi:hypothetical protein HMPREF1287_01470 [Corynebacterium sp. KPL1986]|nr:hypothetical protein HMPREF1293_02300 [Corynebacterium sp. KPL1996]ERS44962.1 hypothetical protein HMPREF1287_01470 [Corynebacterium sp. KPL1986]ERS69584.1 hypothetical protein HMPREF1300_02293 [Corynebacterium sp. KPL2004]ERS69927.1 hypothetical protein HMPREF1295_02293 [Corynebacterium sp. KPL1998]